MVRPKVGLLGLVVVPLMMLPSISSCSSVLPDHLPCPPAGESLCFSPLPCFELLDQSILPGVQCERSVALSFSHALASEVSSGQMLAGSWPVTSISYHYNIDMVLLEERIQHLTWFS